MSSKKFQTLKSSTSAKNYSKRDAKSESPHNTPIYNTNKVSAIKHSNFTPIYRHIPTQADQKYYDTEHGLSDFAYIEKNIRSDGTQGDIFKPALKRIQLKSTPSIVENISQKRVYVPFSSPLHENNFFLSKPQGNKFF